MLDQSIRHGAFLLCSGEKFIIEKEKVKSGSFKCKGTPSHEYHGGCRDFSIHRCPECGAPVEDMPEERDIQIPVSKTLPRADRDVIDSLIRVHVGKKIAAFVNDDAGVTWDGIDANDHENHVVILKDETAYRQKFMQLHAGCIDVLKKVYDGVELKTGLVIEWT